MLAQDEIKQRLYFWARTVMQSHGWSAETWAESADVKSSILTRGILGKTNVPNYLVICRLAEAADFYPEDAIRMFAHYDPPEVEPQ